MNRYEFDNCSAEVVLTRMNVRDGRIVLPDGMSYRVLVLPDMRVMTPRLLARIQELVRAGATVAGPPPTRSPSLSGYPACDEEVRRLSAEIWGDCNGESVTEHRLGAGQAIWGPSPEKVLADAGVPPDFSSRTRLNRIHRTVDGTDLYFVANPEPVNVQAVCSFRIAGRKPELWRPETGEVETAPVFRNRADGTDVLLQLGPSESVFVVFGPAAGDVDPIVEVTRDGKRVISLEDPGRTVVIDRAVYGLLNDPQATRDVKDKLQRIVDNGDDRVQVAQLARGDDPAPGRIKTLTVDYRIGQARSSVSGKDPDTIVFATDGHKILVQTARYGVLSDPARTRDVREKVQRILDAGERSFLVTRMAQGDDPAFLVIKTLALAYTIDGRPVQWTGTDQDMVRLVPPTPFDWPVRARWCTSNLPGLEAGQPGRYAWKTASGRSGSANLDSLPEPLTIPGPWDVRFPPGEGAPGQARFEQLVSWSDHGDPGIRHFSGGATYRRTFEVVAEPTDPNRHVILDLGNVQVMAGVSLNGRDLGLLWKAPYRVEVTPVLRPGPNDLEIRVVNLWPNRLIGDEELPDDSARSPDGTLKSWPAWVARNDPSPTGRQSFVSWRMYKKGDALLPSGLLGPVRLVYAETLR
jgi:hypothetical protein